MWSRKYYKEAICDFCMNEIRELRMVKGAGNSRRCYVIRYYVGRETDVIEAFTSMASDSSNYFSWYDAAVLSYQMGRRLEYDLDKKF